MLTREQVNESLVHHNVVFTNNGEDFPIMTHGKEYLCLKVDGRCLRVCDDTGQLIWLDFQWFDSVGEKVDTRDYMAEYVQFRAFLSLLERNRHFIGGGVNVGRACWAFRSVLDQESESVRKFLSDGKLKL